MKSVEKVLLSVALLWAASVLLVVRCNASERSAAEVLTIEDPVEDLARLNTIKPAVPSDQQQEDQDAAANGESLVKLFLPESKLASYINQQRQKEQLEQIYSSQLLSAASVKIPHGKRRLDEAGALDESLPIISMGGDGHLSTAAPLSSLERMALAASRNSNRKLGRGREANGHMHNKIVDFGHEGGALNKEQLAAARRSFRVEEQSRANKRKLQGQESQRRSSGKSYPPKGRQVRVVNDPDEDGPATGGATSDEEDAERASDRRSDAFERDAGDDVDTDSKAASGRRKGGRDEFSSLDSAEDASGGADDEDEQSNANDEEEDDAASRASGSRRGAKRLRQAASNGSQRQSSAGGRQQGRRGGERAARPQRGLDGDDNSAADEADDDESTDSTNTHQRKVAGVVAARRHDSAATNDRKLVAAIGAVAAVEHADGKQSSGSDLQTAAGHHHGHSHGHYYQFVEVPKKKAWKFGFKRGNHKHEISRKEKGYKHKFHSEFHWHAKEKCKKKKKCKSVGKMTWDYKHHKKHHH